MSKKRKISIDWSAEDVQEIRPDLTDEQAWEVLLRIEQKHDASIGINWTVLEIYADDLFPDKSSKFNCYEVHGLEVVWVNKTTGEPHYEQCPDHRATSFGLFGHLITGGLESISNHPCRADAERAAAEIREDWWEAI